MTRTSTYNLANGFKNPAASSNDNTLEIYGTSKIEDITYSSASLLNGLRSHTVDNYSTTGATIPNSGLALIAGGTGIALLTLTAPVVNSYVRIKLMAIASGTVIVKTATGTTFDGTNNTATFDAANDEIELAYFSATQWQVITNTSVVLSST